MTAVNQKFQGSLRLRLQYELTYLTGRETRLLIFANIHWRTFLCWSLLPWSWYSKADYVWNRLGEDMVLMFIYDVKNKSICR